MAKRRAQGRSDKAIMRCLKRYIIREVHRAITTDLNPPRSTLEPARIAA